MLLIHPHEYALKSSRVEKLLLWLPLVMGYISVLIISSFLKPFNSYIALNLFELKNSQKMQHIWPYGDATTGQLPGTLHI